MKHIITFTTTLLFAHMVWAQSVALPDEKANAAATTEMPTEAAALPFAFVNKEWLQERMNQMSDTTYVINFWATWCKPCVEELPLFNGAFDLFAGQNVTILLISNDSKKIRDTKLADFMKEKGIRPQVLWMNESNPDDWINIVNPNWSGAIPYTLVMNKQHNFMWFKEGETTFEELQQKIQEAKTNH
jgi:thiol-disulfide isomerase/thioredoxin